jgi:hypothetical protein
LELPILHGIGVAITPVGASWLSIIASASIDPDIHRCNVKSNREFWARGYRENIEKAFSPKISSVGK